MTLLRSLAVLLWLALAPAGAQTVPAANASPDSSPAGEGPGPWHDPPDPTRWPNQTSRANGDRWLVEHHDRLRQMRPRVLVVNFSTNTTARTSTAWWPG